MGYVGFSMSVRAVEAYKENKRPLNKWSKKDILQELKNIGTEIEKIKKIPLNILKEAVLVKTEWHHTGKFYNKTDFYTVDTLSEDIIFDYAKNIKENKKYMNTIIDTDYIICEFKGFFHVAKRERTRAGDIFYINNKRYNEKNIKSTHVSFETEQEAFRALERKNAGIKAWAVKQ